MIFYSWNIIIPLVEYVKRFLYTFRPLNRQANRLSFCVIDFKKPVSYQLAIDLYEHSFEKQTRRPRFTDELLGIMDIYIIQSEYGKAAETCGRIIDLLENEWGITEGDEHKNYIEKKAKLFAKA